MLLALASGAALLAVVGWGLVRAAAQDRDRAELAARRDAQDLASALRAFLQRPEVLELVPAAARFAVRDGGVVVDDAVGWLTPLPASPPDAVFDERLRQAQLAEFVRGDAAATRACYEDLMLDLGCDPRPVAAAAWQAHRAGDHAFADRWQQGLVREVSDLPSAAMAAPERAAAVVSIALLAAARDRAVPDALLPLLAALPPEQAEPVFARLAEHGALAAALPDRAREVQQRRALLAAVHSRARELPPRPAQLAFGDGALLWFPDGDAARGSGAVVDGAWLAALPGLGTSRPAPAGGLPPLPDRGTVVTGRAAAVGTGDEHEVVPGVLAVAALPAPPLPLLSRPAVLIGAGLALAVAFAASAFAVMRAFRREADAVRARADFLMGVTHELKTPVASIRLVADVLHDDDVPAAKQREYFALLAGETARLSALIDNVLDVGQIERGERAYDLRPCDLGDVVRDAVAAFAPLARRAGIDVVLHVDAAPAPAIADAAALQQALFAVCENARKYAAAGMRLDVTAAAGPAADGAFTIELRDHGPGVPEDEREAIFARFQRGSRQRSGTIPGVGLGLYLARRIVQRHGGSLVCAAPADGAGARFVVTLPLADAARSHRGTA